MPTKGADARGNYAPGIATREELVRAAHEVIVERGFYGMTVSAVAERAGLTRAGLIHHFPSKEHLLLAVMESRFQKNSEWFIAQLRLQDVLDVMVELLQRQVQQAEPATLLVVLSAASIDSEHPAHDWYQERYGRLRKALACQVDKCQKLGTIRDDIDASVIGVELLAMSEGLLLQWLHDRDAFAPVAAMKAIADGLRAPQALAG